MKLFFISFFLEIFSGCSGSGSLQTAYWVSPDGNDAWPGTQEQPLATLDKAQEAIRLLPVNDRVGVTVTLRAGQYRLKQPLVFEPQDSGTKKSSIIYQAAPGETAVISGSIAAQNWSLVDTKLNIYRSSVGQVKTRQLYVNGQRRVRAKTEDYPPGFYPNFNTGGIQFIPTTTLNPNLWGNVKNIEAVILTQWKMMRVPLSSVNPTCSVCSPPKNAPTTIPGVIKMQEPAWNNANLLSELWSFWQVTWFENAYQFLDEPGEWYLDENAGVLYYIPMPGEDMSQAEVELPILESLLQGTVSNIRFQGLTFAYATWLGASSNNGYVADQAGQILIGKGYQKNDIGHFQNTFDTPANISFSASQNIELRGNIFKHLGAVGVAFRAGSQNNIIQDNLFKDISSSAIQLGGVSAEDAHPVNAQQIVFNNLIHNNMIRETGREYYDSAGIFAGFTQNTTISNNTIVDVSWSGISMGWGWGLLDPGSFLGLPGATPNPWGSYTQPTPNANNQIVRNRIDSFLNKVWDGGAIYTTGQQGSSAQNGLLIQGNVATSRNPALGGNTFYDDGGSRYITLKQNVSLHNPTGKMFFGPLPSSQDPFYLAVSLPCQPKYGALCLLLTFFPYDLDIIPYGSDIGGCRTYGDITYQENYFLNKEFFDICPYTDSSGISYPTNLAYVNNVLISKTSDVPPELLDAAGVQSTPATIPSEEWLRP